jgi:hypothetical protein
MAKWASPPTFRPDERQAILMDAQTVLEAVYVPEVNKVPNGFIQAQEAAIGKLFPVKGTAAVPVVINMELAVLADENIKEGSHTMPIAVPAVCVINCSVPFLCMETADIGSPGILHILVMSGYNNELR